MKLLQNRENIRNLAICSKKLRMSDIQYETIQLSELQYAIKEVLIDSFPDAIWVVAEIQEMNINRNGHCYLELAEKEPNSGKLLAKVRATIWAYTYSMLKPYFENATGREFSKELKIKVKVTVEYHELYGFSLNVIDIDPSYTIGDIARQREFTIAKLIQDGVFEMNKEIKIPQVPQRIAVISSETAAGFGDFMNQLTDNSHQYIFYTKLFPAIMQGDKAPGSIISALEKVFEHEDLFDVVAILRGGGSKSDLSCFDDYQLVLHITQFPLPVISGIGHDRDESIADLVANHALKTPTAVAEFLILKVNEFELFLDSISEQFIEMAEGIIEQEKNRMNNISRNFAPTVYKLLAVKNNELNLLTQLLGNSVSNFSTIERHNLNAISENLLKTTRVSIQRQYDKIQALQKLIPVYTRQYLSEQKHTLQVFDTFIEQNNPFEVMKKGYSITRLNGKLIKNAGEVNKGDTIKTLLSEGNISSIVE